MSIADKITSVLQAVKGNRTRIFVVASAIAGAFYGQEAVDALTTLGLSTDQAVDGLIALVAAVALVIRQFTNTPAGKKS